MKYCNLFWEKLQSPLKNKNSEAKDGEWDLQLNDELNTFADV